MRFWPSARLFEILAAITISVGGGGGGFGEDSEVQSLSVAHKTTVPTVIVMHALFA